jgi:hypothetical protein
MLVNHADASLPLVDRKLRLTAKVTTDPLPFIIGIDAEWTKKGEENFLLSWQWHGIAGDKQWAGIRFPNGERITIAELLQAILEDGKAKGIFQQFPKHVVIVAHFALAEVSMLADFNDRKTELDSIRRTFITLQKPMKVRIRDRHRNVRNVQVTFRDSMLLTPQGAALKLLGDLHGVPKVELPPGAIEHMDDLLLNNRELFTRYAMVDAEIAALHAGYMRKLNEEFTGESTVPVSLGGMAAAYCIAEWKRNEINPLEILGKEVVEERSFSPGLGCYFSKKSTVFKACLHDHEASAVESYHGGRNEAYYFGASPSDDWFDWDLAGAYSTALATLGKPLWPTIRATTDVDDFGPDVMGYAHLRFRFPGTTKFPCLPVRCEANLIFPLAGETHATAAEIWLARKLEAEIEIIHGVVIDTDKGSRPFEAVIKSATQRRIEAKKAGDGLRDKLFKELINSMYGKTAQGLRGKRVFDTRSADLKDLPPSPITNPFIAAYVTGLVRAVLGEIMNALPGCEIISCTTDGFITNANQQQMESASQGPLCELFREARVRLTGDPVILEVKRRASQVLCWRTRGQATLVGHDGSAMILAKAGIKPPRKLTENEVNEWIVDHFVNRDADTKIQFEALRTLLMLFKEGGDLMLEERERRLKMDFDFKRKPGPATERETTGKMHLAFESTPWKTVENYQQARDQWKDFQKATGRCLKTIDDLHAFQDYLAGTALTEAGLQRSATGGTLKAALRLILRAFVKGKWGFGCEEISRNEFIEYLCLGGYEVTKHDLKNATRTKSKLVEHVIPRTNTVMALLA